MSFRYLDVVRESATKTVRPMKRNANSEVLRCLLMFLIVLYHCAHFGIYNESRAWWLFPLTTLLLWHVDCFVSISGWFGIRPTLGKFFRLWCVVLFYSLISFAWETFQSGSFVLGGFSMRGGWFVGVYLALMLTAPILNAAAAPCLSLDSSSLRQGVCA